jgi:flavin reductase (DIM6/NTAB) family NADH-FMN oxidoreductase RutF
MSHPDIFYQPPKGETSGLPHDPFKSFVIPRPIGWISTTSRDGKDNLAPFSQFTNVSFDPPTILYVQLQAHRGAELTDILPALWDISLYINSAPKTPL